MTSSRGGVEQKCSGNTKHRAYFFTINNIDEAQERLFREHDHKYYVYQIEQGESGTVHLQGMMYFGNPRVWGPLKTLFPLAHIEACKDVQACIKYCTKEKTRVRGPYEGGVMPEQGKRCDLHELHEKIKSGEKVLNIRQDNPIHYHQYGRTLNQLESDAYNMNIRNSMTEGVWIFGSTGKGKSHMARELCKGSIYIHNLEDKGWWDNYKQQDNVIIDDFRGEIKYNELLKLVDKWEHSVIKRGQEPIQFTSKAIIITSSLPPHKVYKNRVIEDSLDQLKRRFIVWDIDKDDYWDWCMEEEFSLDAGIEAIMKGF